MKEWMNKLKKGWIKKEWMNKWNKGWINESRNE